MHPSPKLIRVLRRVLLALVGAATLLALFVTVENWRGDRAWAALEREMRARGERIHFSEFAPPPVPDAQNFFAAPLLAETIFVRPAALSQKKRPARAPFRGIPYFPDTEGAPPDFIALRAQMQKNDLLKAPFTDSPALDILNSLEPAKPLLDELRTAARTRPQARVARNPQPTFSVVWLDADSTVNLGHTLAGRARAEIALGQIADAHADIFALQRYANGLTAYPANLLEFLIGLHIQNSAQRAIADGIQRRVWTDAQLAEFQNQLAEFHPLAAFREGLLTERAVAFSVIDSGPGSIPIPEWPRWLFHGWAQQNKVSLYRLQQSEIFSTFTLATARITPLPQKPPAPRTGPFARWVSPYEVISRLAIANVAPILVNSGAAIDRLSLDSVACALERHRLAHGRHPGSLAALVPHYLPAIPTGIFDGEPLRYLALPDGSHQLRTAGKNGRDDPGSGDDVVLKIPAVP